MLDLMAIGAHPDDVELSCSGTLIIHKKLGWTTGILDLTEGELGSRGNITTRREESKAANKILNIDIRENLGFKDGFFENNETHQLKLIQKIRQYRPRIILATAIKDRHPDHGRAAQLIKDACFLAGLVKIETTLDGQPQEAWRPKKVFNYIQDMYLEPDFVVDISDVMNEKINSILAYSSQFNVPGVDSQPRTYISSEEYLQTVKYRNIMMGKKIGVKYGEGFLAIQNHLGIKDFTGIILPEFV